MKNFYKLGAYIVIFSLLASCTKSDDNLPEPEKAQTTATTTTASIDTSKTAVDSTDSKLVIESTGTSTTGTTKPSISSSHFHHHHHTPNPKPTTPKPTTPATPVTPTPKPTTPTATPKPTTPATPVTTTPKPTTPTTTPKPTTPATPVTTTPKPTTPTTTPKPTTPATPVTTTPKPTTPTTTPKPTTPTIPVTTTPKPTTPTTTPKPTTPTTPVTTTPKPTTPVATKPTTPTTTPTTGTSAYKVVAPIYLYNKSNVTISGDSIAGGSQPCIQLINCTNIHITKCRLGSSKSYGILIGNSSNILVDSNFITKVASGVLAIGCPNGSIRILSNQILNTQGPFPLGAGIQFSAVGGGNNHVDNNRIQNVVGQCNPEDKINLYKSNGLPGDPITVKGNWILGSGTSTSSCGITLGDQGGSYEVAQDNIIVNSGAGGAQIAGGTYISIINNTIYSAAFPWSHMGILCANYSGQPSNNLTISGNKVNWTSGMPNDQYGGSTTRVMNVGSSLTSAVTSIIGASTNILNANINASILPASIITFK